MEDRFQTFTVLIAKISRSIKKLKSFEMDDLNLKGTHAYCIYYLYRFSSLTAKELGELCQEDKASISRTIEYLECRGYIECLSSDKKKYNCPISLTQEGIKIGKLIANKSERMVKNVSLSISKEERADLYNNLNLISEKLENLCNEYEGVK